MLQIPIYALRMHEHIKIEQFIKQFFFSLQMARFNQITLKKSGKRSMKQRKKNENCV